ncbi:MULTISPECIES: hypothetical protein [Fischerella]|uniref:Uncharacterized protein n=1 Tax=Fischerella muscicola CCMEE 5323 TaxID=2019572 RepID=A0A2N6K0G6_FISMU|nr:MULTISPECIES: hypothetical protein [Fischerella]MBD2435129.1 hypothetical protein [Fischerella sp. FACHB-380]PLZ87471.1 hypothetical protein CEN44_17355 [Fischerella muscicola CCMEE 5323]
MRVQDGYLFKRQSAEDEIQGDRNSGESSQDSGVKGDARIIQNVRQYGEKSMTFGQASNFRIGDDYYQSEPPQKKTNDK